MSKTWPGWLCFAWNSIRISEKQSYKECINYLRLAKVWVFWVCPLFIQVCPLSLSRVFHCPVIVDCVMRHSEKIVDYDLAQLHFIQKYLYNTIHQFIWGIKIMIKYIKNNPRGSLVGGPSKTNPLKENQNFQQALKINKIVKFRVNFSNHLTMM